MRVPVMRHLGLLILLPLLVALATGPVATTHADGGVAIDRGGLYIAQRLTSGARYSLPVLTVRNPGNEPSAYQMTLTFLEDSPARRPDPGWFSFEPQTFHLQPGGRQSVHILVTLPEGMHPGDYEALVQAGLVSTETGNAIGAAAAAPIAFTVDSAGFWPTLMHRLDDLVDRTGIWGYAAAIAILSAIAALVGGRLTRRSANAGQ